MLLKDLLRASLQNTDPAQLIKQVLVLFPRKSKFDCIKTVSDVTFDQNGTKGKIVFDVTMKKTVEPISFEVLQYIKQLTEQDVEVLLSSQVFESVLCEAIVDFVMVVPPNFPPELTQETAFKVTFNEK